MICYQRFCCAIDPHQLFRRSKVISLMIENQMNSELLELLKHKFTTESSDITVFLTLPVTE